MTGNPEPTEFIRERSQMEKRIPLSCVGTNNLEKRTDFNHVNVDRVASTAPRAAEENT